MRRETVWSQQTPDGRLTAVVMMETDDVDGLMADLTESEDPFTRRFRESISEVHGVDITKGPLPEVEMLLDARF